MTEWQRSFFFKGKELGYNRIRYNNPTERCVEIPIAFDFLANLQKGDRILEVGNVLSYYENTLSESVGIFHRKIVDKFEQDLGVDNQDLMDLPSTEKYDAILSISTVEHIGQAVEPSGTYGERTEERDLEAPLKAIAKIYDLLDVGGKAFITVPFGTLTDGDWQIQFSGQYLSLLTKYGIPKEAISSHFLKLIDRHPVWEKAQMIWAEADGLEVSDAEYNYPLPYANAIAAIELTKVSNDFHLDLNVEPTPLFYHPPYDARRQSEQSQAQLHQTQGELEQSQAQLHQTQGELGQSQAQLHQTQGELGQSQAQLHQTQRESEQNRTQLWQTQAEMGQSQAQLHQIKAKLEKSQARLLKTQGELLAAKSLKNKTTRELKQSQSLLYQAQEELEQSQFLLRQAQQESQQSLVAWRQAQEEREQSQAQSYKIQREWEQFQTQQQETQEEMERSRLQQAMQVTVGLTNDSAERMQYTLLVLEAWYAYQSGNLTKMQELLQESLKCTHLSRTETVNNWLENFGKLGSEQGKPLDSYSLTNSKEWKQLMRQLMAAKPMLLTQSKG